MTATETAFGKPIQGTIQHYTETQPDKYTAEEFAAALDEILKIFPALQWQQYTPYFNDGDACVFGVHDIWFFTEAQIMAYAQETDGLSYLISYPDEFATDTYSLLPEGSWVTNHNATDWRDRRTFVPADPDSEEAKLYATARKFEEIFFGCTQLLHKTFGDPATIIANEDGFRVEHCDHE